MVEGELAVAVKINNDDNKGVRGENRMGMKRWSLKVTKVLAPMVKDEVVSVLGFGGRT